MKHRETPMSAELQQQYRNTFSSPEGRVVFADILLQMGYFATNITGEGPTALRNEATDLVFRVGAGQGLTPKALNSQALVIDKIIDSVTGLPGIEDPEPEEDDIFRKSLDSD